VRGGWWRRSGGQATRGSVTRPFGGEARREPASGGVRAIGLRAGGRRRRLRVQAIRGPAASESGEGRGRMASAACAIPTPPWARSQRRWLPPGSSRLRRYGRRGRAGEKALAALAADNGSGPRPCRRPQEIGPDPGEVEHLGCKTGGRERRKWGLGGSSVVFNSPCWTLTTLARDGDNFNGNTQMNSIPQNRHAFRTIEYLLRNERLRVSYASLLHLPAPASVSRNFHFIT
jgi:hypothetical protein